MDYRSLLLLAATLVLSVPALAQEAQPPTPAPATTSGAAPAEEVAPGPLVEARKMLWTRIGQAKSEGIGTAAYVTAFKGIEDEVKAGKTAEELRPRIESLARSLKDQLDRSKILKTQRPAPPTGSQVAGGSSAGKPMSADRVSGGLQAALGGKDPSALLDKVKDKLNTGDIPDSIKEKFLNSDKGRKLLEKLSQ